MVMVALELGKMTADSHLFSPACKIIVDIKLFTENTP